tara:strand:- start:2266 stop:3252 length:987 start_codon:yes stop_codon:yes gene_type:complete
MSDLFGGGSSPNIIIAPEKDPTVYQTIIPRKSYQDLAQSIRRTQAQINQEIKRGYRQTGTESQIGARQRGIELQEAASYAASLPGVGAPNQDFLPTPGSSGNNRRASNRSNRRNEVTGPGFPSDGPRTQRASNRSNRQEKNPAKQAADLRLGNALKSYKQAVKQAGRDKGLFVPLTRNPGYAQNDSKMFIPKKHNKLPAPTAETETEQKKTESPSGNKPAIVYGQTIISGPGGRGSFTPRPGSQRPEPVTISSEEAKKQVAASGPGILYGQTIISGPGGRGSFTPRPSSASPKPETISAEEAKKLTHEETKGKTIISGPGGRGSYTPR